MNLNETPSAERIHIGFFGCTNSGKSSLVNAVTGQDLSVVSDIKGTTTDAVKKTMELLPLGPVVMIDTPGYDDESLLGEKRIVAAEKILHKCDIAVLVTTHPVLNDIESRLISLFKKNGTSYLIAVNKSDLMASFPENEENIIYTSALEKTGIDELKNALGKYVKNEKKDINFVGDLIGPGNIAVLVTPIDSAAPKGRLILPQQLAVRDIIDFGAVAVVTKEDMLENTLASLKNPPDLVITDSQVFKMVNEIVPKDISLTSFSILMARYKGFLETAVNGVKKIDSLKDGSRVLISEGCTHHRQCDDIGTVKLPKMLKQYTQSDLEFEWSSGNGFPEDLSKYDLVIHCGGCMVNDREMKYRMNSAQQQGTAFTNYGTALAYMQGILSRVIAPIPELKSLV